MEFDQDILNEIWEKGRPVNGLDPDMFRLDACGALIMRARYGAENPFGWEVDHIFPKSRGGDENIDNLRPLHYKNNKSKSNDFPSYIAAVKFNGKENEENKRSLSVNDLIFERLKELYKDKVL